MLLTLRKVYLISEKIGYSERYYQEIVLNTDQIMYAKIEDDENECTVMLTNDDKVYLKLSENEELKFLFQ